MFFTTAYIALNIAENVERIYFVYLNMEIYGYHKLFKKDIDSVIRGYRYAFVRRLLHPFGAGSRRGNLLAKL
jgi:hypothetical protein